MAKPVRKKKPKHGLWLHSSGQWCKKYRGRFYYFGTDEAEAVKKFVATWEDLKAGRPIQFDPEGVTLRDLVNHFLSAKRDRVAIGELTQRSWNDYYVTCEYVLKNVGPDRQIHTLRAPDFAELHRRYASNHGPVSVANFVQRVRTLFKYGFDAELLQVPLRFGPMFRKPSRRSIRLQRAKSGPRTLTAADVRSLLAMAGTPMKAMILLGINCGFGNGDCAQLVKQALERPGWIDFVRPKTGVDRRAKLWPETVEALEQALAERPDPVDPGNADLVFITRFGHPWVRQTDAERRTCRIDSLFNEYRKLCKRVKIEDPSFYRLRHTFRTVADGCLDTVAVGLIMGHVDDSIAATYRHAISDDRLERVTNHVRDWLFAEGGV